ncbi:MAG: putative serine/threonine protein kinase [Rhodospirillaceae bacterium]|nr:MAG: putative serine/threonine protein kinase [Rhodospirillaceae bacterium]
MSRPGEAYAPGLALGQTSACGPRARNEDFHGAVVPDGALIRLGTLVCVADGIGGSADGRLAAEMTVRGLLNDYYATPMSWSGIKALHQVATSLNGWLFSEGKKRERGLGTTLVAALFRGRTLSILTAGGIHGFTGYGPDGSTF